MAQLIVRNLDEALVRNLKMQAAEHGRSAEAEHREILRNALTPSNKGEPLKKILLDMPDVGEDEDFTRVSDVGRDLGRVNTNVVPRR